MERYLTTDAVIVVIILFHLDSPNEAAMCEGEIRKKWCSYREKALKNLVA